MIEDKLDKLIELNERIVNQNDEIINLLKGDDNGEKNVVESSLAEEPEDDDEDVPAVNNVSKFFSTSELSSGELLFVANSQDSQIDIYKISVKASDELKVVPQEMEEETRNILDDGNYEITIENLTGNSLTSQFKMPLLIAVESFNENMSIPSNVAILDDESYVNIPDILRVAIENGAEKIYLSMKNAMSVLQAPPMIMDYLQFYKNKDDLLKHL
ncbi:hypothetical protein [Methanobrevibacter millerae]|uniref:Uncharacterized protein n=1 Tax=Methanobrevibacter millerae TaxID=230361 RepID=A0A0U2L592_9EURY|nr:hypothetical protein [Methanobrevibacter millerae]ALT68814.1 hypothetical protein sm9_1025 [Methanobrevibacter millerae]MBP3225741.1 hypothetical protein [Methanobrevibacter sp.]